MQRELCAECVTCFEQLLSEPLGSAILSYINSENGHHSFMDHFFLVRENLMKNKYKSPQLFLDDFNQSVAEVIKATSSNSDFSICLSYFKDKVNERMKKFLPGSMEMFGHDINRFKEQMELIIQTIPNDMKSMEPLVKKKDPLPGSSMVTRDMTSKPAEQKIPIHQQFDLLAMKTQIGLLLTDEDSLEVTQIVMNHEPYIKPNENGDIEIDLHKCMPYTLTILKNLLDNAPKANPPPSVPSAPPTPDTGAIAKDPSAHFK